MVKAVMMQGFFQYQMGAVLGCESSLATSLTRALTAENNSQNAWNLNFSSGQVYSNSKNLGNLFRAVAALGEEVKEGWLEAYYDCCKNKLGSRDCDEFRRNYEAGLWQLVAKVEARTYRPGEGRRFVVTRPKRREVLAADFRDRIVHHWLYLRLNPLFEELHRSQGNVSHNCRKGFGTRSAVLSLMEAMAQGDEAWVAKFDVCRFFASIDPARLWDMLRPFIAGRYCGGDKDTVLWLTEAVLGSRDRGAGLPIGNLPSQIFANFFLSPLDAVAAEFRQRYKGFGFVRYVDDFAVVGRKGEIMEFRRRAAVVLRSLGLELHDGKVYMQQARKGIVFVGTCIRQGRLYAGRRAVRGLHEALGRLAAEACRAEPCAVRLRHCVDSANSYLGATLWTRSYGIRRRALARLPSGVWRYCHARGSDLGALRCGH